MHMTHKQARELGIDVPGLQKRGRKPKPSGDGLTGRDKVFDALCAAHGLAAPVHEYPFHPERKWKFDFLFEGWLAVEKVGGVWNQGHHSRGQDQIDDMEKFNEAVIHGYSVLQFTPEQFDTGAAFSVIRRALEARGEQH